MKLLKMVLFVLLVFVALILSVSFEKEDRDQKMIEILVDGKKDEVPFGTKFSEYKEDESRYYAPDYLFKADDVIDTEQIQNSGKQENDQTFEPVSINAASVDELVKIPGIGEKTALKIIEYRETMGGFRSLEELMNVPGIKEKKYGKIKDYISI